MSNLTCRLYGSRDLRIEETIEPVQRQDTAIIRVIRGGICKPEIRYYNDGAVGPDKLQSPLVLGHEAVGIAEAVPFGSDLKVNQVVALSPLHPCGACKFCRSGQSRHCLHMRVYGSAKRLPHDDGFFRSRLAHPVQLCRPISESISTESAACVTPLAVCLNAFSRAPSVEGKRVLIAGMAQFGAVCTALARLRGASEVIVANPYEFALKVAEKMGADRVINVVESYNGLAEYMVDKGQIDVVFECSTNAHALAQAIRATRPQGTIMQIGVGETIPVAVNLIVAKELQILGAYYFDETFADAAEMISSGEIDLSPMVTQVLTAKEAVRAFELASDHDQSVKVQIDFAA